MTYANIESISFRAPGAAASADTPGQKRPGALSPRELDVLIWLARGKSGAEVAQVLGLSVCTVRAHIRNILRKLDAANIAHAVAQAFRSGVLDANVVS